MKKKELIFSVTMKDFELQTFRAGGKGGQHQNKTETGVRLIHHPSGAVTESREERSQLQNKKNALKRMGQHPKFLAWVKKEAARLSGEKTVEERIEEMMRPENLKFEVRNENGKWEVEGRVDSNLHREEIRPS